MKDEDRIHKIMHGGKHVANVRTYRGRAGGWLSQVEHPDGSSASKKYNVGLMDTKKDILSKIKKYHSTKNEQKDSREYGYEGEMAMSQLKGILMHAKQLHDMLEPDTDLPEWVQSKITLAYDYIQTAADYMSTEMNESKDDVPFEGPYRKVGDQKDRYGNPIKNVARHLAKKAMNDFTKKNEEVQPANAVGGGKIAGMGVGPQGEPGVGPKAMKRYKSKNAAKAPKAGRKTLAMFMQGTK